MTQEELCTDCRYYDGFGCEHPKVEPFPFKVRRSYCKYYIPDDFDDDLDAMVQAQWEQEQYFNGEDWDD